jgi:hypothetical protein
MNCQWERTCQFLSEAWLYWGFGELEETERTFCTAKHAPVFMVHDLHQKWKQPVAHYLNHRNTKANLLLKFLNGVLSAHQNAGLHVVSTVHDTGVNTVKALKLLCANRQKPFFKFQNQEIVNVWSSTPRVHQNPVSQIQCAVSVYVQPFSCNFLVGTYFKWMQMGRTKYCQPLLQAHTRWCSWLSHCAISQKVAGSIPNSVTGIFHWHPSGRTMAYICNFSFLKSCNPKFLYVL